jgi:homoserine O-acetyltransferase
MYVSILSAALGVASAQTSSSTPALLEQAESDFIIKNFRSNSGEVLSELRLHYVTLRTPHRNSSGEINYAVLLHSTGGRISELLTSAWHVYGISSPGLGSPLDLNKSYFIIPDGIGQGKSSRPSDGLREHFPNYGYKRYSDERTA